MRLKLAENLPHDLADELTLRGHDVDTVLDEQLGGRKDPVVVEAATDDDRLIVTLDRGVGDIRNLPPGRHAGVVVLRPVTQDPVSIRELVDRLLDAQELDELRGCVAIVEPHRVRVRRPDDPEQR